MYQQGMSYGRGTQDWQLEAYEYKSRHNSIVRHQRAIDEMENRRWKKEKRTIIK